MVKRKVTKHVLKKHDEVKANLEYWLSRTPEERISAMEVLRRQRYGDDKPIQKVARIIRFAKKKGIR
jgi:hypothetical protein